MPIPVTMFFQFNRFHFLIVSEKTEMSETIANFRCSINALVDVKGRMQKFHAKH